MLRNWDRTMRYCSGVQKVNIKCMHTVLISLKLGLYTSRYSSQHVFIATGAIKLVKCFLILHKYIKVVLQNKRMVGAILIGDTDLEVKVYNS